MHRQFDHFEEVEKDIAKNAPAVVYKYRSWEDDNHKKLLSDHHIWFSHPFKLNDPLDVRPDTVFDVQEFNDPRYLQKLLDSVASEHPYLNTDYERRIVAENQWDLTKTNPDMITENLKNWNSEEANFDRYGVFSTGMDELSEKIWVEYGQNHAGYCVGFDTVELCRQILCGYGYVTYSNAPYQYSFFKDIMERDLDALYLKKTKWSHEKEFRFITVGIGIRFDRLQVFKVNAVKEIILGYDISIADEKKIMKIIDEKYPPKLPIYKTAIDLKDQLIKKRIR